MDNVPVQELVLKHWGIKGQKWGLRRFQNKDGSLTPEGRNRYSDSSNDDSNKSKLTRKQRKEQARKDAEEAKAREESETVEQKRERLLKSSDASELYKNRDLLSTAEINERLNRIDTEKRLAKAAEESQPAKKTVLDKVDTVLKYGRKVNEVYEFTNTPVMKALKKKMGLEKEETDKSFDIKKIYENRDKLSDEQIKTAANRAENYGKLKKVYDSVSKSSTDETSDNQPTNTTDTSTSAADTKRESKARRNPSDLKLFNKPDADDIKKTVEKATNTTLADAKKEVSDAVSKVPKSPTLRKEAVKEIVKEVGPELDEVISTFNDAMIAANQKRLNDHNTNNR